MPMFSQNLSFKPVYTVVWGMNACEIMCLDTNTMKYVDVGNCGFEGDGDLLKVSGYLVSSLCDGITGVKRNDYDLLKDHINSEIKECFTPEPSA